LLSRFCSLFWCSTGILPFPFSCRIALASFVCPRGYLCVCVSLSLCLSLCLSVRALSRAVWWVAVLLSKSGFGKENSSSSWRRKI
jgi:hypothetical protein